MGLHVPRPVLFGWALATEKQKFFLFLTIVTLLVAATANLLRSRIGRAFMAIRDDEFAAASMGIPTALYMVLAFAWSGIVVGTGGALYAVLVRQVSPEAFGLLELIVHFGIVIIGGLASLTGSILGAIALTMAPELLRDLPGYEELLIAADDDPHLGVLTGWPCNAARTRPAPLCANGTTVSDIRPTSLRKRLSTGVASRSRSASVGSRPSLASASTLRLGRWWP